MATDSLRRKHVDATDNGGEFAAHLRSEPRSLLTEARDVVEVPPLDFEDAFWIVDPESGASRAERERHSGPYESSITPPIAELELSLSGALAASVDEATRALAEIDAHSLRRLGTGSGAIGPMAAILLRTESTSSSRIENLTVGARQLALAEIDESSSQNAKVVVANVRAMEAALRLADQLDEQAVLHMQRELLQGVAGWEQHAGVYRQQLVWVGKSSIGPVGATHIAPRHERVPEAMRDLMAFVARDDIPPLVQAAIAHAQFETIHPFVDGNGRTGRALVHAMLRGKGLVVNSTVPVSAGLLADTGSYFAALEAYRRGDAAPIIERFASASRFAATRGSRLVDDLAATIDSLNDRLTGLRSDAAARKVVPHLVAQPIVNASHLVRGLGLNEMTAQRAMSALVDRGVLVERSGLRRNRVYAQEDVLAILDGFAESIFRT